MRLTQRVSTALVAICGLSAGIATWIGHGETVADGFLLDAAVSARSILWPPPAVGHNNRVAVIVLDRRSLNDPELLKYPRTLFAPVWARLIDSLAAANARTIAFDFLFSYSANRFIPNYDRAFLLALHQHRLRIVLGRTQGTLPATPYFAALGLDKDALGLLELEADADGVHRHIPMRLGTERTLAGAALRRAGIKAIPTAVLLAPRRRLEEIPTFALIDVLHCAKTDPMRIRSVFGNRIVFIGTSLPEEDRRLTAGRFLGRPRGISKAGNASCNMTPLGASTPRTQSVPGVYLHAGAAEAVLSRQLTVPVDARWRVPIAAMAAGLGAILGLFFPLWSAAGATVAIGIGIWSAEVVMLNRLLWFPASPALFAMFVSVVAAYLLRYLLEERRRHRVQDAFNHFLSPVIVDRLMEGDLELSLGGKSQEVSVLFVDLSGFTEASTRLSPQQLVAVTNDYIGTICEEIEAEEGYVVQIIGDEVMVMWGAPIPQPDHSRKAVSAGRRVAERLATLYREKLPRGETAFWFKIGINAGTAVVGNVGAEKRYCYTALGELVNIASRLQGVARDFGCTLVVSESIAATCDDMLMYELDLVQVAGKAEPLRVFEPIARQIDATAAQRHYVDQYSVALAAYRRRDFDTAAHLWAHLKYPGLVSDDAVARDANSVTPPQVMAARAAQYSTRPPPSDWSRAWERTTK